MESNGNQMKSKLKTIWQFLMNPRLLLCLGIAWVITNGWSYIVFGLGTALGIDWMIAVGGAYLAFLWLPISPEKLVTFTIAIALLRWWFPNDEKTLAVLKRAYEKTKAVVKQRTKKKTRERKQTVCE